MTRNMLSFAGFLVAAISFTVGSDSAEARNCGGRQRNRCCQQSYNCCSQQTGYSNYRQGRSCGYGCGQSNSNYGPQVNSTNFQQNGFRNTTNACCAQTTTSCCNQQSGIVQSGYRDGQSADVIPASHESMTSPSVAPSPPIEPAKPAAPTPGA